MQVVIRTDASYEIGTGHVMRCLTLADALTRKKANVSFICMEHEGHLCDLIEERGHAVHRLPAPRNNFSVKKEPKHAAWLGASWQEDAEQTISIIESLDIKPDWLVVDHYAIDYRWERSLRPLASRIFVIDDLADRNHECDLLLDQNLVDDINTRYMNRVPENCLLLLGPQYALLAPIYAELYNRIPPREGPIRHILVSFGGVDAENLTSKAIEAFITLERPDIEVDVVIPDRNPHSAAIQRKIAGHPNLHMHGTLPTLAPLMAKADLAIGAAGSTSWERLCLGLPAIVITLAENQRSIANGLSREGVVWYLGHKDEVTVHIIQQALSELIKQEMNENWSYKCHQIVDGKGVDRVCTVMTISSDTPIHVRHARLSDEKLLLTWANDPVTRRNSFSPELISSDIHRKWFHERLRNIEGCQIYIIESPDGIPLGQVRFEKNGENWEIDYSLAPELRGRGLGQPLLESAIRKFRSTQSGLRIIAKVKRSNLPSRRVFESLDFIIHSNTGGEIYYQYQL